MYKRQPHKRTAQHRAGDACKESTGRDRQNIFPRKDKFERNGFMDNRLIHATEVAEELGVSVPYAYKIVRKLNEELQKKGYMTVSGKVSRKYFHERFYGKDVD